MVEPHTEADPAALLFQFLVYAGAVIGRGPHFLAESDRHGVNEYVVLVGETSKGRKGTSHGRVRAIFERIDEDWTRENTPPGLVSGEGLIYHVRDPIEKLEHNRSGGRVTGSQTVISDPGVDDKRLLVVESEFASVLRVIARDGNTLSPIVRTAWDGHQLKTLAKNSPIKATDAHIAILGHITRQELDRYLATTELMNGFANRFLWVITRRSKLLPDGGRVPLDELECFVRRLSSAIQASASRTDLKRDDAAAELWCSEYAQLSEGAPGVLGAVLGRAEAHTMRLATLYALLDRAPAIGVVHLQAGLAAWDYAKRSAEFIFGSVLGDPLADRLWKIIRPHSSGISRTEIQRELSNHGGRQRVDEALRLLEERGFIRSERRATAGRPVEMWFPTDGYATEAKEATEAGHDSTSTASVASIAGE